MSARRRSPTRHSHRSWIAIAAAVVVAAGVYLFGPASRSPKGLVLTNPRPLPQFNLQQTDGNALHREAFLGHWSALYPGYTHCPDVCPTTLAALAQATRSLDGAHVQVVFLSVDPARDSIAALRRYVRGFDPSFVGANGSDDELARLASALGIGYSAPSAASPPSTVDHSATVILIDPKARIAGYIQPPFTAAALREDLRQVVAGPTT